MRLKVSETKEGFMKGNDRFFYLADTVWSVFSNASLEDWKVYLEYRKAQQFNTLQISVLPILHDTSDTYVGVHPFAIKPDGEWDFYNISEPFFQKAEKMVQMVHLMGHKNLTEEEFIYNGNLDFYMYQSGHNLEGQRFCYEQGKDFYAQPVKRPIVNGEPCYEGHGHGMKYGRFDAFDVRKAFWWSVLSGAKAGFTYGAHGLFSWHQKGAKFTSEHWSKIPFDWKTALRLQGAWDVSFCKWLFEKYDLFDIEPANDRLLTPYDEIRMAASPDKSKIAIYIPYSNEVKVDFDLSGYELDMIELAAKHIVRPTVETGNKASAIKMHDFNSDVIILGTKL